MGASLWGLSAAVLSVTGDTYVSAAVVLGTFVVPVALSVRVADSGLLPGVDRNLLLRLFVGGGVLGFLASAFLEQPFTSAPYGLFAGWAGIVEESLKLSVLVWMTWNLPDKTPRSGFVLGSVVGFGYSAVESAGYALSSFLTSGQSSHSLMDMVVTRAAITPFTHGLWTAVVGAVLFSRSRHGRHRITPFVVAGLVLVALVHAGWDILPNLATNLDLRMAGRAPSALFPASLPVNATAGMKLGDELLGDAGLTLLSLLSLFLAHLARGLRGRDPQPGPAVRVELDLAPAEARRGSRAAA